MKLFLVLLACGTFLSQDLQAQKYIGATTLKGETLKDISVMGPTVLSDVKANSIDVLGPLSFKNLKVKNEANILGVISKSTEGTFKSLNITGPFEASDVISKYLNVVGPVAVSNLTVEKEAHIVGPLKAKKSHFHDLTITAHEIALTDTEVEGNIVVKKSGHWLRLPKGEKKQVLRLKGKTTVKGTITFESEKGVIEQGPDVKIKGKVTGATVEKK